MSDTSIAALTQSKARAPRNQAVELLRIVSAFAIIAFHAQAPGAGLFYAGLVFFVLLSPLMDVAKGWHRTRTVRELALALMVPWLFWTLVYGALDLVLGKPMLGSGPWPVILLLERGAHLWFLPFLFVVLLATGAAKRSLSPALLFWISAIVAAVLLASAGWWRPVSFGFPSPIPQWLQALPAVFAGIALGLAARIGTWSVAGLALVAGGVAAALVQRAEGMDMPYAIALSLTAAAVFLGGRPALRGLQVQPVADCMFGVYLVHLITLPVASRLVGFHSLASAALAFAIALAGVWAARRLVPATRLVLG